MKVFFFQTTADNFRTSLLQTYYILLYIICILCYIILYHINKKLLYHNIAFSVLGEKFQPGSGPGQFCKPTSTQVQYIDCQILVLSFKDKHLQIIFPGFLDWYRLHC